MKPLNLTEKIFSEHQVGGGELPSLVMWSRWE